MIIDLLISEFNMSVNRAMMINDIIIVGLIAMVCLVFMSFNSKPGKKTDD